MIEEGGRFGVGVALVLLVVGVASANEGAAATAADEAQRLGRAGDYARALDIYARLVERFPEDVDLRMERARTLAWAGQGGAAREAARSVVEAHPTRADAWALLADVRVWSGDASGAREILYEGLSHAPDSFELHERLARLEYREGNVGGARTHMTHAVRLEPGLIDGRRALAVYSPWTVETSALHEELSDRDPWRRLALSIRWRPAGAWSASVGGEQVRRFSRSELAARVGLERLVSGGHVVWAAVGAAPGAEIIAQRELGLGASWRAARLWRVQISARELGFSTGSAQVVRVGGVRIVPSGWEIGYALTWARDVRDRHDTTHSLRALWAPVAWSAVSLESYYGSDVEQLDTIAGDVTRTTLGFNLAWRFVGSGGWGLRLQAGHAVRRDDYTRTSIGVGITRHFR